MSDRIKFKIFFYFLFLTLSNVFVLFLFVSGCLAKNPELTISPSPAVQTKAVGRSALLTCQADVDNKGLITDLVWKDPQNRTIDAN